MQQVKEISEPDLLTIVQKFCPRPGVGDDAALVTMPPGQQLVVSTDVLVDGVHFSLGLVRPGVITMSPTAVGWRAAAANLSDLAAMGARSLGITVGLSLPLEMPVVWVEDIYQGLRNCLDAYGPAPILGGDLCRSSVLSLAITALGEVTPGQAIQRQTAQPGDAILVTGVHGAARAGLELLLHPAWGDFLSLSQRQTLIQAHQYPRPRLDVIALIHKHLDATRITGMDSSDGLADAVLQICQQSQTGAHLYLEKIPLVPELPPDLRLAWGLYGGEDFELVLTLAPDVAQRLLDYLPSPAAIIGEITATPSVTLITPDQIQPLDPHQRWQHFGSPSSLALS